MRQISFTAPQARERAQPVSAATRRLISTGAICIAVALLACAQPAAAAPLHGSAKQTKAAKSPSKPALAKGASAGKASPTAAKSGAKAKTSTSRESSKKAKGQQMASPKSPSRGKAVAEKNKPPRSVAAQASAPPKVAAVAPAHLPANAMASTTAPGANGSSTLVAATLPPASALSPNLGLTPTALEPIASSRSVEAREPLVASALDQAPPPSSSTLSSLADPLLRLLQSRGVATAPAAASPTGSGLLDQVRDKTSEMVVMAMNFIGVRYRYGGNTAETGFDCSGFTRYVFENSVGLVLPRRSAEQAQAPSLLPVAQSELKPGDLVFFNTLRSAFSHVGIYLGDGKFIHSPRTGSHVRIDDMRFAYWAKRYNGARRAPQFQAALESYGNAPAVTAQ